MIYWYDEIYSSRVEATARMLGQYTLYYLIFPQLERNIKLRYANTEFFHAIIKERERYGPLIYVYYAIVISLPTNLLLMISYLPVTLPHLGISHNLPLHHHPSQSQFFGWLHEQWLHHISSSLKAV